MRITEPREGREGDGKAAATRETGGRRREEKKREGREGKREGERGREKERGMNVSQ